MNNFFRKFAQKAAEAVGSPGAFIFAILLLVIWGLSGPVFHFSDSWQIFINTITTIITFLMVFLIQNLQNHDAKALHLKLDELIRSMHGARNSLVKIEDLSDADLDLLQKQFRRISEHYSQVSDIVEEVAEEALGEKEETSEDSQ